MALRLTNLRDLRRGRQLTQDQLAEAIHRSRSFVNKVECGHRGVSMATAMEICEALHCQLNDLGIVKAKIKE